MNLWLAPTASPSASHPLLCLSCSGTPRVAPCSAQTYSIHGKRVSNVKTNTTRVAFPICFFNKWEREPVGRPRGSGKHQMKASEQKQMWPEISRYFKQSTRPPAQDPDDSIIGLNRICFGAQKQHWKKLEQETATGPSKFVLDIEARQE